MRSRPRPPMPTLPTDPAERAYVEYRRTESAARRALNGIFPSADWFFLMEGKPLELVIPEGTSTLDAALVKQEARKSIVAFHGRHGTVDNPALNMDEAYEACLVILIESNPVIDWRSIINWLNMDRVPSTFIPSVERDSTEEEDSVRERRLVNDLNTHAGQRLLGMLSTSWTTYGEQGLETSGNPDSDEDIEAIPFVAENQERIKERLEFYRDEVDRLTTEIFFFDPGADLSEEWELTQLQKAADAYSDGLERLTGTSSPQEASEAPETPSEPLESPDVESVGDEALDAPVTPSNESSGELAQELLEATETGAQRLSEAHVVPREYLTPQEVATLLQKSLRTVWELLRTNKIPGFKVGNQYRINRTEFEAWQKTGGTVAAPKETNPRFDYFDPGFDPGF